MSYYIVKHFLHSCYGKIVTPPGSSHCSCRWCTLFSADFRDIATRAEKLVFGELLWFNWTPGCTVSSLVSVVTGATEQTSDHTHHWCWVWSEVKTGLKLSTREGSELLLFSLVLNYSLMRKTDSDLTGSGQSTVAGTVCANCWSASDKISAFLQSWRAWKQSM